MAVEIRNPSFPSTPRARRSPGHLCRCVIVKVDHSHRTARTVPREGGDRPSEQAPDATLRIQLSHHIHWARVGRPAALALDLEKHLHALCRRSDQRGGHGGEASRDGEFGNGQSLGGTRRGERVHETFAEVVTLHVGSIVATGVKSKGRTQKEMANMGVTPKRGGVIPRYIL